METDLKICENRENSEYFEYFMEKALEQAEIAKNINETPVGCVIVENNKIIATGYNRRESDQNALAHAEIAAIKAACEKTGFWRLTECDLYVTLEPCPMCAGAIINSRIKRVIFGAFDKKSGAFGSVINLNDYPFNHKPDIISGVLEKKSGIILSEFFKDLRENK
ncbi:MAG: tRNA adenosine(34) deaminase TadA [Oscillospiraceae bacterium]|nr:tRNA adenosine(34) deaminase TadA [Oscillospiraceae bacterium]